MLAFHHVQADGLVLTATSRPMVSPDATASAAMSGCASWIRKEDWSKPQASCTLSGPGPYSPSCSATKPQRLSSATCRYSVLCARPVCSASAAMLSGPSCRASVASIQDAIRAGADRGSGVKIHLQTNWSGDYQFMALILQIIPEN